MFKLYHQNNITNITTYDVTALFTAFPVTSAYHIIKNRLKQITELLNRTIMSSNNIVELLGSV